MRVKRYVAKSIEEATAKIKKEMGIDAVILHTRYFKEGGFLGFFKKSYVEVTAATEEGDSPMGAKINPRLAELNGHNSYKTQNAVVTAGLRRPAQDLLLKGHSIQRREVPANANTNMELSEMKSRMSKMNQIIEDSSQISVFPKLGQDLMLRLRKQEVEEKLAERIVRSTLQQVEENPSCTEEQLEEILVSNMLKLLGNKKPGQNGNSSFKRPVIYALVGPTGVGKTTTIAKLAAMHAIMEQKRVAFVTVDTYRIAAVEQLRTIAEIMDVPVSVVYSLPQMKDCLLDLAGNDVIFIDTAGRSHKNAAQLAELKEYLDVSCPDDTFLVLSSTSKYQDLLDILKAYQDFDITSLIFTKLDETSFYGSIYNIACRSKIPLSYSTNGQNIPDDIETADPRKFVQLLIKE